MRAIVVVLLVLVAACTSLESSETQEMPVPGEDADEVMGSGAAGGTYLEGEAPDEPAEDLIAK